MAALAPTTTVRDTPPAVHGARCRLCSCLLEGQANTPAAIALGTCDDCALHPEARATRGKSGLVAVLDVGSRQFTIGDKSLIKKVNGFMPAQQLLDLLNDRLRADLGPKARPYTMAQLHAELRDVAAPANANDWAGLRKVLAQARRAGVLTQITAQVIDDFAVVFSLTPAQVMRLKDVILAAADTTPAGDRV